MLPIRRYGHENSAVLASVLVFTLTAPLARAVDPNPLIDYTGFEKIVVASANEHEQHRLTEDQFLAAMKEQGVVLLDARTAFRFEMRHIKGAVNLPFTEFAAAPLAAVIPDKGTKILIYCNNNFDGDQVSMIRKCAPASLNLSTYTSLKAYGYLNIYELGPLLDVKTTKIPFEGNSVK